VTGFYRLVAIWSEREKIYRFAIIYGPKMVGFRGYVLVESERIYRLTAIYSPKVSEFTVSMTYLGRKWPGLSFRVHIWAESGRIYRLEDICGPKEP